MLYIVAKMAPSHYSFICSHPRRGRVVAQFEFTDLGPSAPHIMSSFILQCYFRFMRFRLNFRRVLKVPVLHSCNVGTFAIVFYHYEDIMSQRRGQSRGCDY